MTIENGGAEGMDVQKMLVSAGEMHRCFVGLTSFSA